MSRYLRYAVTVFILAIMIGAVQSTPAKAGQTVHPDGLDQICLCFGRFFNGFNATGTQPNGRCARSQTGPFCFVDTRLMPLFWKESFHRECNSLHVALEGYSNCNLECPPNKMVLSCNGQVDQDDWYYTYSKVFPASDGSGCIHEISISMKDMNAETVEGYFNAETWAICASPPPLECGDTFPSCGGTCPQGFSCKLDFNDQTTCFCDD